ncbi:hypothetical protein EVAR_95168_1 [Eumeta japonica]|uniref:Uncharacterized protein n=1 Tax=Eumeta variegata TaxID=151549 RepID=A0A4C1VHA9_EUMVA|nr:hypothetical protein EVAR_95168_1 [Eumeta japonica]
MLWVRLAAAATTETATTGDSPVVRNAADVSGEWCVAGCAGRGGRRPLLAAARAAGRQSAAARHPSLVVFDECAPPPHRCVPCAVPRTPRTAPRPRSPRIGESRLFPGGPASGRNNRRPVIHPRPAPSPPTAVETVVADRFAK